MKKILIAFLLLIVSHLANAQKSSITLNYDMTLPSGGVTDFISQYSFRGMSGQYRYLINPNIGIGFDLGYNSWYQKKTNKTYEINPASTITGTFYNYMTTWTMHVAGDYYFGNPSSSKIRPYLGVGLGVNQMDFESYVIDYIITNHDNWPFSVSPEAGLLISEPYSPVSLNVGVYYNYTTQDYSPIFTNLGYFGFRVGVAWH